MLDTVPSIVDRIYAVDDCSTDKTLLIMSTVARRSNRVIVVHRERRGGVGAAIVTGHKRALEDAVDVVAVMAGDGQMDPAFLDSILDPVVEGKADYAKGNRFSNPANSRGTPGFRRFGSHVLDYMSKIASGYWHISDPQQGYTAVSRELLENLDLDRLYKGFAFENDMLVELNVLGARVVDVPVAPIYADQSSKIRYPSFIASTSWVLFRAFVRRLLIKYVKKTIKRGSKKSATKGKGL